MIETFKSAHKSDFAYIRDAQPDTFDALICAFVAWLYHFSPLALAQPPADIDPIEGWVFATADGL